jgi:hypothetical protein
MPASVFPSRSFAIRATVRGLMIHSAKPGGEAR